MTNLELLSRVDAVLANIDTQNQLDIARREGFNEGYKTCLKEIKQVLEADTAKEAEKEEKNEKK